MIPIQKFRTFDNTEHETKTKAITHLENVQGAIISKHAHALAQITKYVDIVQYLADNFMDFETAIKAEKDRILDCADE